VESCRRNAEVLNLVGTSHVLSHWGLDLDSTREATPACTVPPLSQCSMVFVCVPYSCAKELVTRLPMQSVTVTSSKLPARDCLSKTVFLLIKTTIWSVVTCRSRRGSPSTAMTVDPVLFFRWKSTNQPTREQRRKPAKQNENNTEDI
jgi:hypothetical protein